MTDDLDIPDFDPTPAWARILFRILVAAIGTGFIAFGVVHFWLVRELVCQKQTETECASPVLLSAEAITGFWLPVCIGVGLIAFAVKLGTARRR